MVSSQVKRRTSGYQHKIPTLGTLPPPNAPSAISFSRNRVFKMTRHLVFRPQQGDTPSLPTKNPYPPSSETSVPSQRPSGEVEHGYSEE